MIYTSYFGNLKNIPSDIVPISICGKAPDWYTGIQYKKLAPKWTDFKEYKETGNEETYTKNYYEHVLNSLDQKRVYEELLELSGRKDIALLCYETPEKFCHRHLVEDWMFEKGFILIEYGFKK